MYTEIKKTVAEQAALCGADAYEITINGSASAGAETLGQEISSVTYQRSGGMTVRCVKNNKSGYASSHSVTVEEAARLVRSACANALVVDHEDELPLFEGSDSYETAEAASAAMPSADELKAMALELQQKTLASSDKIVDGTQSFAGCDSSTTVFLNSAGLDLRYENAIVYHGVVAAVKDGEEAAEEYMVASVAKKTPDELVKTVVDGALSKLGGEPVASGKYDLILDSGAMRSMLSTFSAVFSAKSAFLKTTLLAGKEGQQVAGEVLTITDDPFHPDKYSHCPFDAEGVAVRKKNVIENGILKTLLYNRMYAGKFGVETTGNAASAKEITPKGLYVAAGELTKEALLEKLGNGLYITELKGLHAGANVQSGDFSLEAAGFLVENGKKVRPVKNITVADNFFTMLKKVAALSDKVEFGAVDNYGAPEVLLKDMSVSGK